MIICNPWGLGEFAQATPQARTSAIVFANGWSAPTTVAKHLGMRADTDIYVLTNHQAEDWEGYAQLFAMLPSRYDAIDVIGFSFGNAVLHYLMGDLVARHLVCISGTPEPFASIDLEQSRMMAEQLDVPMYKQFIRGLSRSRVAEAAWADVVREDAWLPTFAQNKSSLQALVALGTSERIVPDRQWTGAIIPTHDRIAHADKQRAYWTGRAPIHEIAATHWCLGELTDWNGILGLFDDGELGA